MTHSPKNHLLISYSIFTTWKLAKRLHCTIFIKNRNCSLPFIFNVTSKHLNSCYCYWCEWTKNWVSIARSLFCRHPCVNALIVSFVIWLLSLNSGHRKQNFNRLVVWRDLTNVIWAILYLCCCCFQRPQWTTSTNSPCTCPEPLPEYFGKSIQSVFSL